MSKKVIRFRRYKFEFDVTNREENSMSDNNPCHCCEKQIKVSWFSHGFLFCSEACRQEWEETIR